MIRRTVRPIWSSLSFQRTNSSTKYFDSGNQTVIPAFCRSSCRNNHTFPAFARLYSSAPALLSPAETPLHYEWIEPHATAAAATSSSTTSNSNHTIVFLHGLLGNGRNLRTFASKFCERRQGSKGLLVDLPGHGKSKGRTMTRSKKAGGPVTFDDCVQALQQTLQAVGIGASSRQHHSNDSDKNHEFTLLGHSLGGRVALQYADSAVHSLTSPAAIPHPQPTRLILLDTVPGRPNALVAHVVGVAEQLLEQFRSKAAVPPTRRELTKLLVEKHTIEQGTAQWLASMFNERQGDFAFDVQVAKDLLRDFDQDFNDKKNSSFVLCKERVLTRHPSIRRVDLVRGGKNKAWEEDSVAVHLKRMETWTQAPPEGSGSSVAAAFYLHVLPNADHWVHVDDLPGLLDALDE